MEEELKKVLKRISNMERKYNKMKKKINDINKVLGYFESSSEATYFG